MKKVFWGLSAVVVMSIFTGCEETNIWSFAAGGKDADCNNDAACLVDGIIALKNGDHKKAQDISEKIHDAPKKQYLQILAASIKTGGIVQALQKFAEKNDFTINGLGSICPTGTLETKEIDTLLKSDQSQYKQMGRICLATEAKQETAPAGGSGTSTSLKNTAKLLDELKDSAVKGEVVGGSGDTAGKTTDKAAAGDICKVMSPTGDSTCADVTTEKANEYLKANL